MPSSDEGSAWRRLSAEVEHLRAELAAVRAELEAERAQKASTLEALSRAQVAERVEAAERIRKLEAEIRRLKKHFLGPKSEKIPTPDAELRRADGEKADPAETQRRRMENALLREPTRRREIRHRVPDAKRTCPHCQVVCAKLTWSCVPVIEYVGDAFEREQHILEILTCDRCGYAVMAEAPLRVVDGGLYGPGFFAFLIVSKCGDSIPIYRLEKRFKRLGIPMSRSTMNDLLHAAARALAPLYDRLMALIRQQRVVRADETSMRVQKRKKRGFVWTFLAKDESSRWLIGYKFSPDRSGETPRDVLKATAGVLLVDMYTGYNVVIGVEGRTRGGCNAHARRNFHESLETAPEAALKALEFYLQIYAIEREAKRRKIFGTAAHLELRQSKSKQVMAEFKAWLEQERPNHLPKGPMGQAISYALKHWQALTLFLEDARIPVDNNDAEGALRVIALGRKNFLAFGNDEAGQNIAMLYSLVSTCAANGVNPIEYLKDVLIRVQTHPASRIDELLPHLWSPRTKEDDGGDDDPHGGGLGGDRGDGGDDAPISAVDASSDDPRRASSIIDAGATRSAHDNEGGGARSSKIGSAAVRTESLDLGRDTRSGDAVISSGPSDGTLSFAHSSSPSIVEESSHAVNDVHDESTPDDSTVDEIDSRSRCETTETSLRDSVCGASARSSRADFDDEAVPHGMADTSSSRARTDTEETRSIREGGAGGRNSSLIQGTGDADRSSSEEGDHDTSCDHSPKIETDAPPEIRPEAARDLMSEELGGNSRDAAQTELPPVTLVVRARDGPLQLQRPLEAPADRCGAGVLALRSHVAPRDTASLVCTPRSDRVASRCAPLSLAHRRAVAEICLELPIDLGQRAGAARAPRAAADNLDGDPTSAGNRLRRRRGGAYRTTRVSIASTRVGAAA